MTRRRKVMVGIGVVVLLGTAAALSLVRGRDRGVPVRLEEVGRTDLVSTVTASGNIRARRSVDISSDVSARVASLEVAEGEEVVPGQILLRLDPTQFEAGRSRADATLSQARAQLQNAQANFARAEREFARIRALHARDSMLVSLQQIEDAQTELDVARSNVESARFGVQQAQAGLAEQSDRAAKTTIRSPIAGRVTRLNIEEGETVIVGTMNNPGSLLLTVADLSVVEVVVQVDETDVPELSIGDSAAVEIDAFPGRSFPGRVTEIGNSAIQPPTGSTTSQAAIDFEVVITLDDPGVALRPDLSATAEIVTETRENVLAVPIIALTVRDRAQIETWREAEAGGETDGNGDAGGDGDDGGARPTTGRARSGGPAEDVEGVFVVEDGAVRFVPVEIGIAGYEYFEVLTGVAEGDTVAAGPYQTIRQLSQGDRVRPRDEGTGG